MNLLNLPFWNIVQVAENKHDYVVEATFGVEAPACVHCGVVGRLYRHGTRPQRVMDVPSHGKRVGIDVTRTRWRCQDCGKTFLQPLPDVAENGTMTKRLVSHIESQSLRRPFTHIADEVGVAEGTVRNVFNEYVDHLDRTVRFETPRVLGIDEVHFLRHPRGIITNIEASTIIGVLEERNKKTVNEYLFGLPDKERIKVVTMDMWRPYRDTVRQILPDAVVVVDKFHVVRMATDAVQTVRRGLRDSMSAGDRRKLMRSKYLLLKRMNQLDEEGLKMLKTWVDQFPVLFHAYAAKEGFYNIWDAKTRPEAEEAFREWVEHLDLSVERHFRPLTTAMTNWREEIFAYWDHRYTNAKTEALNGIAKLVNRMGRGYSFKAIRAKLLYAKHLQGDKPKFGQIGIVAMRATPRDIEVFDREHVPKEPVMGTDLSMLRQVLTESRMWEQKEKENQKKDGSTKERKKNKRIK